MTSGRKPKILMKAAFPNLLNTQRMPAAPPGVIYMNEHMGVLCSYTTSCYFSKKYIYINV